MIPGEAVEAAAQAMSGHPEGWDSLPDKFQHDYRDAARTILEAAAPHILAGAVQAARANNDHIVEGGNGYSSGFHYALHCISPDA